MFLVCVIVSTPSVGWIQTLWRSIFASQESSINFHVIFWAICFVYNFSGHNLNEELFSCVESIMTTFRFFPSGSFTTMRLINYPKDKRCVAAQVRWLQAIFDTLKHLDGIFPFTKPRQSIFFTIGSRILGWCKRPTGQKWFNICAESHDHLWDGIEHQQQVGRGGVEARAGAVSYTHLTLPTILLV